MMDSDKGFSTPLALAAIFSLCATTLSFCMLAAANEKIMGSYKKTVSERKKVDAIVYDMEEKIQPLKDSPSDADEREVSFLLEAACDYRLTVMDASTGINKNFAAETFLKNKAINDYITETGDEAFVEYGWMNPKLSDKAVLEQAAKDFESGTFPLANSYPPLNAHFMNESFLKAVLGFCGAKEPEKKARLLKEKLSPETGVKEMAELLGVGTSDPVLDLIGTKTVFWKVGFETESSKVSAVFAAVPEKESQKKIEKYILVKKEITSKGGAI